MDSLVETLKTIGIARLAVLGVIVFSVFGIGGMFYSRVSTPDMVMIYGGIDAQDASKIVTKLESLGLPFQLKGDGTHIYVPADQSARIRMFIAEAGLPSGGSAGYEILDRTDNLGATSFLQDVNYLRALEGELAKTIKTINGVGGVRVHLVMPKKELFSKNPREASASIVVKMSILQRLNSGQVRAISHLVSSAVPGLNPQRISIIDDQGTLLARGSDKDDGGSGGSDEQQTALENRYAKMVESLLERSLGVGKVQVEATVEMETDRITENSEIFDPNGQIVRSTQNVEEGNNSSEKSGGDTPVSVQNALPNQPQGADNNKTSQTAKRNEETVNYEISKTLRTKVQEGSKVKRLSIAVLVDGSYKAEKNEQVYVPRPKAEIDQITALVKSAIGFKAERGDTVEIINMRFAPPPVIQDQSRTDMILGLEKHQFARLLEILLIGVVGLIALIVVVRPITLKVIDTSKELLPSPELQGGVEGYLPGTPGTAGPSYQSSGGGGSARFSSTDDGYYDEGEHEEININRIEGKVKRANVKKVEELIETYPKESLNVIRSWMNSTNAQNKG